MTRTVPELVPYAISIQFPLSPGHIITTGLKRNELNQTSESVKSQLWKKAELFKTAVLVVVVILVVVILVVV